MYLAPNVHFKRLGVSRNEPVLIIGGGVLTDTGGLACALYHRNTPYVMLSTSIVAGIDAGTSPRNCCDGFGYKNLFGAYHAPVLSLTDRSFFKTLKEGWLRHGIAEIIKMATKSRFCYFSAAFIYCQQNSFVAVSSNEAAIALIQAKGLSGSTKEQQQLCQRYSCNPLALKIVATSIQDLFGGKIGEFLAEDTTLFYNIRRLLEQQFERLSPLEQSIMYWLAINREWTTIPQLVEDITPAVRKLDLLEALESLMWRSLIEKQSCNYTLQCVI